MCETRDNPPAHARAHTHTQSLTDQCFVVNLLPDELVLAEGVASLSCDGVDGSLLHLLLHGTVKHEERLAGALLVGAGGGGGGEERCQRSDPRTEECFN